MDSARVATGDDDDNDDELVALLVRKALVNGHNDMARALNLMNVIRSLFIGRSSLVELGRIVESGRVDQLLSCIQRDDHKLDTAKFILDTMQANMKKLNSGHERTTPVGGHTTNRRVVNFLLKLFQIVNDNVSPLADEDELERLGQMVVFHLELIAFDDIQERLTFYTRCRSCVGNLHLVLEHLIRRVLKLPGAYKQMERKRGARQNFLNGCLAFALATIPAFYNKPQLQLELSCLALELALKRSSLSLANYYVKHILSIWQSLLMAPQPTGAAHEPKTVSREQATQLESRLASILALIIEHQAHIDLRHKLALAKLVKKTRSSSLASESLLQSLEHLDCVELLAQDEDAGSGNANNIGNNNDDDHESN